VIVTRDDDGRPGPGYGDALMPGRSLVTRVRAMPARRQDAVLGTAIGAGGLLEAVVRGGGPNAVTVTVIVSALLGVAVAFRRRTPATALVAAMTLLVSAQILGGTTGTGGDVAFVGVIICLFSAGAHADFLPAVASGAFAGAMFVLNSVVDTYADSASNLVFPVVFTAGTITAGRAIRNRRLLTAALRERNQRLEAERESRAREAVEDERRRIATELHDVVTHAVTSMVVEAGAVRHAARADPALARDALGEVEDTGRAALGEMRRLLGVLRKEEDETALAPQPSLARVALLVDRARAAGLEVTYDSDDAAPALTPGLDLVAYRVVEEALRAAANGAGARHADVRVRCRDRGLELEVSDDGAPRTLGTRTRPDPAQETLGGIRERVSLFGGELSAGARRDGRFVVHARLPLTGATA
jgi:signal transduction histidine kinase